MRADHVADAVHHEGPGGRQGTLRAARKVGDDKGLVGGQYVVKGTRSEYYSLQARNKDKTKGTVM